MVKNKDEDKRTPGLIHVPVCQGLELPILDITSPRFTGSISQDRMDALQQESPKLAEGMRRMPEAHKMAVAQHSLIFGRRFNQDTGGRFLSGISTYILKLGPGLMEGMDEYQIDQGISRGISSMAARMRLVSICRHQTEGLKSLLKDNPARTLCLINIGGGAASDSINTLILLQHEEPSLLEKRRIEIHILEIDPLSPAFALRCVDALQGPGQIFSNLDIAAYHHMYDWEHPQILEDILQGHEGSILFCSSEGGLFEYGRDEDIRSNLEILHRLAPEDTRVISDIFHDHDTVDPTLIAMAETSGAVMRFMGLSGLEQILENSGWELTSIDKQNPVYIVFSLQKVRE